MTVFAAYSEPFGTELAPRAVTLRCHVTDVTFRFSLEEGALAVVASSPLFLLLGRLPLEGEGTKAQSCQHLLHN